MIENSINSFIVFWLLSWLFGLKISFLQFLEPESQITNARFLDIFVVYFGSEHILKLSKLWESLGLADEHQI